MEKSNKYNKGKIYKIMSNVQDSLIYIGSTVEQYLSDRYGRHRRGYLKWKDTNTGDYLTSYDIFDKYGITNCKIILLESCNVNTRDELMQREQHYIDTLDCVNKNNAFLTTEQRKINKEESDIEYRNNHPDQKKIYYNNNKEAILQKQKIHYEENKEEILQKQKVYKEKNVEKVKERKRLEKIRNADKYNTRAQIEIYCEACKYNIKKCKKARHEKTLTHLNNLEKQI
jgi:hypothetical protein